VIIYKLGFTKERHELLWVQGQAQRLVIQPHSTPLLLEVTQVRFLPGATFGRAIVHSLWTAKAGTGNGNLLSLFYSVSEMHSASSVTLSAFANLMAVDTLHSSLRSMFSMVRTGTSARADSFGTDKPCSRRIARRFIESILSVVEIKAENQQDVFDNIQQRKRRCIIEYVKQYNNNEQNIYWISIHIFCRAWYNRNATTGWAGDFSPARTCYLSSSFISWRAVSKSTTISSKSFIISIVSLIGFQLLSFGMVILYHLIWWLSIHIEEIFWK